jgi:TetR/AcrR family transcriptional repressor of nem operon
MSDIHDGFRARVQAVFDRWTGLMQRVLDEAKAAGELDSRIDTAALAATMIAAWEGAVMLAKARKSAAVMQDCARSLKALLALHTNGYEEGEQ